VQLSQSKTETDEEIERKIALKTIDLQIIKTLENIKAIKEEKEMLDMMEKMKTLKSASDEADRVEPKAGPSSRNWSGPLLSESGKVNFLET
jgi:hypothetical protein